MTLRVLVALCVTVLMTASSSPSNITMGLMIASTSPFNITTGLMTASISPFNTTTSLMTASISPSNITTDLMTSAMSPSNITAKPVTRPDSPWNEMFENATRNYENVEETTTPDDNIETVIKAIQNVVYKYYTTVAILCSSVGCILTIFVLLKNKLKSSADVYIMSIALINLVFVTNYLIWTCNRYDVFKANRHWQIFFSYYRAFLNPFNYIVMSSNNWTIMAFAAERLLAIRYPFKARIIYRKSRAMKISFCILIVAFLTNLTRFLSRRVEVEIDPLTNETIHRFIQFELDEKGIITKVEYYFYTIAAVIVPIIVLGLSNIAILISLRRVRKKRLSLKEGASNSKHSKDVQIERVLIAYLSAFFVCNIMAATTLGTVAIYGRSVFDTFNVGLQIRIVISTLVYTLNPAINAIAFVCCDNTARETVKDSLCSLICCSKSSHAKSPSAK